MALMAANNGISWPNRCRARNHVTTAAIDEARASRHTLCQRPTTRPDTRRQIFGVSRTASFGYELNFTPTPHKDRTAAQIITRVHKMQ